jgi:hypothetical protein
VFYVHFPTFNVGYLFGSSDHHEVFVDNFNYNAFSPSFSSSYFNADSPDFYGGYCLSLLY